MDPIVGRRIGSELALGRTSPDLYGAERPRLRGHVVAAHAPWRPMLPSVPCCTMIVLKSKLSGYYFKDFGDWTPLACEGFGFPDEWAARDFVRREHMDDVQVIEAESATEELLPAS